MHRRFWIMAVCLAASLVVTCAVPLGADMSYAVNGGEAAGYEEDDDGEIEDPMLNPNCGVNDYLWGTKTGKPISARPVLYYFENIAKKNGNVWYGKRPKSLAAGNPVYYIAFLKNDKTGMKPTDQGYKKPTFRWEPIYDKKLIDIVSTDNGQFGIRTKVTNGGSILYSVADKSGLWCETARVTYAMLHADLPMVEVNRYGVVIENKGAYGSKRGVDLEPSNPGIVNGLWVTFRSLRSGKPYSATVYIPEGYRSRVKLPSRIASLARKYGSIEWQASFYPPEKMRSRQSGHPALLTYENPTWFTARWTPKAKESAPWMRVGAPFRKMKEYPAPSIKPRAYVSTRRGSAVVTLSNKTGLVAKYKVRYKPRGTSSYRTRVYSVKSGKMRSFRLRVVDGSGVKVWYSQGSSAYRLLASKRA